MVSTCYHAEGVGEYDEDYFNTNRRLDIVKNDLAQVPLIRNNQIINSIILDGFKEIQEVLKDLLRIIQLRTEIKYGHFQIKIIYLMQFLVFKVIKINLIQMKFQNNFYV